MCVQRTSPIQALWQRKMREKSYCIEQANIYNEVNYTATKKQLKYMYVCNTYECNVLKIYLAHASVHNLPTSCSPKFASSRRNLNFYRAV